VVAVSFAALSVVYVRRMVRMSEETA
jgi:hypothetical protein